MSTSLDLGGGLMPSAQLESLLSQMVQGDPEQIRQAEEALTPALSTPAFMLDLLTRLTQSQAAHVRQLAAVLLRRRIGSHWRKLGAANTNRIKATLLQVLATEPEGAVVRSVAALCASAARHAMSKGGWPELLSCVLEGSRSPTTAHRLVAMTLIASLLESDEVTEHLRPHFVLLKDLLAAALQDAQLDVARGALKALSAWTPALGTEQDAASLLRPLVPLVLGLGARALGESDSLGDDETITLDGAVQPAQVCSSGGIGAPDDDDDDESKVYKMAAQVHVMPLLLELVATHAPSPDPARRRAVLLILAVTAAGCAEAFAKELPRLMPVVYAGCEAPEPQVREAACLAIGLFAQSLHPEILEHYERVLADARGEVQGRACYAIEAFCEHLGSDIQPFLAPLLERLTTLLQHTAERPTQERCVSAIAAVAVGAKKAFADYFDPVYALMRHLLGQTASEMLPLRARAMECVGLMCLAVGRDRCSHVLQEVAELLGEEAAPLVPPLLPFLVKAVEQEEVTEFSEHEQARILAKLGPDPDGDGDELLDDDDDDEEDEEGEEGGDGPGIHTAMLDEKAAAIHCLGACAAYGGASFAPHIEAVMGPLLGCADHFHEDIILYYIILYYIIALPPRQGVRRRGAASAVGALALLEQRHSCQEAAQDLSEGGGVDEEEDHDEAVWEAVSELLTTLPKALGERWTPHLERLLPALLPYLREAHPLSDHALAIGILAEGLNHVEASGRHHLPTILPHAARCASAPDPTCRQNGVFCLGVLGAHGGEAALAQMQPILSELQQRLSAQEEDEAVVRDNAVGALSRIALSFGAALPLDAVLRAIADRLPLTEDEGENAPALRCLMQLLHAEETRAVAAPHMPALLKAIGHLLAGGGDGSPAADAGPRPCPLDAECEAEVRSFLVWAAGQSPQEMQALVMDLPRGREQVLAVLQAHQG
ncbi:hypothetical protein EMIHUDRAFT_469192 [Emiliania huxleyi CCMP1516]|uniref:Importin N-terminal domain-containing protein n=2 Tax=Emiliania huxleyi TaxID=2903 RepID=A0A0D3JP77_EMIH1|nr:hypothetical protein EMIHUDRAFT_469192 [Emiliania huxleyi CCMP1516]EOD25312.1 hypothetical protein EMIHUDRAFT_469192 [Emiliania huxleyi CCMP1516]|eukprot:XP_005777741.1 hypothetical protein EMIHUDRAFT_469192 [Emiliania huxleyi CCMP1516]